MLLILGVTRGRKLLGQTRTMPWVLSVGSKKFVEMVLCPR